MKMKIIDAIKALVFYTILCSHFQKSHSCYLWGTDSGQCTANSLDSNWRAANMPYCASRISFPVCIPKYQVGWLAHTHTVSVFSAYTFVFVYVFVSMFVYNLHIIICGCSKNDACLLYTYIYIFICTIFSDTCTHFYQLYLIDCLIE